MFLTCFKGFRLQLLMLAHIYDVSFCFDSSITSCQEGESSGT